MAERYKVIIADDDKFIREQLTKAVIKEGYIVKTVAESEAVLKLIQEENFDVLVTDIYMEKMSGREMIPIVKKMKPQIQVIAMTGDETIDLEREVRGLGVFAYFLKPIEIDIMMKTLKAALSLIDKNRKVSNG